MKQIKNLIEEQVDDMTTLKEEMAYAYWNYKNDVKLILKLLNQP